MPSFPFKQFNKRVAPALALAVVINAYAQDGEVFDSGFESPLLEVDAAAFLWRATYGPTATDFADLARLGPERWLTTQMAMPPTLHAPRVLQFGTEIGQYERQRVWWDIAQNAPDQLRQRAAFALSQILVVSDLNGDLEGQAVALAGYYDTLLQHAFGNYRDLLEAVTLSPVMGHYLSMFRSTRDGALGIEPDENYAREIMQLFSIGLVELNPDGTPRMVNNQTIPTYGQDEIVALAEAFTGWNFTGADADDGNCEPWEWRWPEQNWLQPMEPCMVTDPYEDQPANYHVTTEKRIIGGTVLPAGQTAEQDMEQALDALFMHPNVGPFLAFRLIQRLVTSNPSPAYVARAAAVFDNNGSGERGDLGAMIRSILIDPEALAGTDGNPTFGKLREPLLLQTQMNRVYDAQFRPEFINDPSCCWPGAIYHPELFFGQAALRSPSVFNFFKPDFAQPGPIEEGGLVSPEFQISTETQVVQVANLYYDTLVWGQPYPWQTEQHWQIDALTSLASNPEALVDRVANDLLYEPLNAVARAAVIARIGRIRGSDVDQRVAETIYYVITSPQSLVQQ